VLWECLLTLVICIVFVAVANKPKNLQFLCKWCVDSARMDSKIAGLSPVNKFHTIQMWLNMILIL